jgi:hypothetical protein
VQQLWPDWIGHLALWQGSFSEEQVTTIPQFIVVYFICAVWLMHEVFSKFIVYKGGIYRLNHSGLERLCLAVCLHP